MIHIAKALVDLYPDAAFVVREDGTIEWQSAQPADYDAAVVEAKSIELRNAEAKAAKHKQIELERDAARYANVVVEGHTWQADQRSQQLLTNAILLAQAGVYTPSVWRTADNVNVPVTLSTLMMIAGAIAAQTQEAYTASWARKEALKAATTMEEVEAV